ncbi:N-acetylgalactosamine-6-sulfatase [Oceaniferula spumae]|uniref:N-acetylgalactosamine-6-sulfatase n=1 Tax=Oceaniferula spumae TaxID=2979115 RepID=A0AAT9FIT5_9BACT
MTIHKRALSTAIILAALSPVLVQPVAAADKPNFVIIFCDDMGYQDLECFGAPKIKTPRIDRMAAEGMKFTSFYGQTVCGPARAALMTGSYPLRVEKVPNPVQKIDIHPIVHTDEVMIPEILKEVGYATAAFGKWDLAGHSQTQFKPDFMPNRQGFDYFFGTPSSNDREVNLLRNEKMVKKKAAMGSLTKAYTDEAIQFIEKNHKQPFFVYLAHSMPHTKLGVSKPFKGKSAQGLYGDVIQELDFHTGRLLDKLKELEIDDNTYVVFTSDNGPWWVKKDHGGSALPLRGAKTSTWEGGLRVPTIIRAPGKIKAGTVSDQPASHMDFLPTFANLAGGTVPTDRVLDGRDLSKLLEGGSDPELKARTIFYYQHTHLQAVRQGKWKLIVPRPAKPIVVPPSWAKMVPKSDLVEITKPMLIDLDADISEQKDVANAHPEVVESLMKQIEWARRDIGDREQIGKNARLPKKSEGENN